MLHSFEDDSSVGRTSPAAVDVHAQSNSTSPPNNYANATNRYTSPRTPLRSSLSPTDIKYVNAKDFKPKVTGEEGQVGGKDEEVSLLSSNS